MNSTRSRCYSLPTRALRRTAARWAVHCLLGSAASPALLAGVARAQDRAEEAEMFGAAAPSGETPDAAAGVAPAGEQPGLAGGSAEQNAAASSPATRDDAVLGRDSTPMFTEPTGPADPLSIGGQLYLRAQASGAEGVPLGKTTFSMPSLFDVYFDARPIRRVRGFVLGRMSYDPTISGTASPLTAADPTSGSPELSSLFGRTEGGPRVVLDQMWLRFDIEHRLFVTSGKQHVRWGTARFWSPADFLHLRRRNPLDVFDARSGTTMLKLHMPIESESSNFYGYVVAEGPDGAPTLEQIAAALRAELVFGQTEIGLGVFARKDSRAKFSADFSSGIGDFDVYAEAALRDRRDVDHVGFAPLAPIPAAETPASWQTPSDIVSERLQQIVDARYPLLRKTGYRAQIAGGLTYSRKYNDNDTFTIGAEYFYNPLGYAKDDVYPGLIFPRPADLRDPATFFYLGKHYAALFALLPSPFSLDLHSFRFSTLGNLSDRSFISRFDYSLLLLTHLSFEAFVALHYGRPSGEFRLGFDDLEFEGQPLDKPPGLIDVGVALRLSI